MTGSELPESPGRAWCLRLEVDEPGARVAAAIDARGIIVGLAAAGDTRDADAPTPWELYSINVTADQRGSGMADDLIRVTAGERDTTVWVLADNVRARSFYARHGLWTEGATRLDQVTGRQQIRMVRSSAGR